MIVRELIVKLGFQLNQAQLNKAEQATNRIKERASEAAGAFRNIALSLASLASVRSIINIADEMQSLRSQVGLLPQVTGDAGVAVDLLTEKANAARQSLANYGGFFVKAGNATKDFITDQNELLRIVDGAAIGIAASGANAVNQSQAFYQLGQAIGSPVVQMEEMNTLIDAAPDLFRALGDVIPGANGQLKKFIGTGSVTGKMLAEALQKVAVVFEDRMRKMPMTVGQAMIIVNNRFSRMIDRMNRESKLVTRIADTMLTAFDKIESGVDRVVKSFDGWNNLLRIIGTVAGVAIGGKLFMALKGVSAAVLIPFVKVIAIVGALALVIEDLYVWVNGEGDSFTGALIGPWEEWSAYVLGAYQMVKDAIVTIGELVGAFGAILMGALTLDLNLFAAGWQGATDIIYNTLATWYGYFTNTINMIADYISDKLGGFFGGIGASFMGAAQGLSGSIMQAVPAIGPASMRQGGNGGMVNNTNVTVTVPPGTPQEQASFLERAAKQSFADMNKPLRGTDMGVYSE